jgi:ABC-type transporter Mla MlaB component
MALFSKPPAKKPDPPKPDAGIADSGKTRKAVSARDVAVQAQGRRGANDRPRSEPAEISMTGSSLIDWSPVRTSIEVAQSNPGLCSVLENAALLYASGQAQPARALLEQGVENDHDTQSSPLAWLALFDLLHRANDRVAFDRCALQYVVQFERSAPAWEDNAGGPMAAAPKAHSAGGYVALSNPLGADSAPQIDAIRRMFARAGAVARLDLASVVAFDDAGAKLLAAALADVRKHRLSLTLQKPEKLRAALEAQVGKGRDAGEGAWLLSLELLQFEQKQEPFEDRAIEYAIAFEQSPPSWEPPPAPAPEGGAAAAAPEAPQEAGAGTTAEVIVWTGVLTGSATQQIARISDYAFNHAVIPVDMSDVERIDFVCAGALLNAISRIEAQRKSVQIVGASPIIRALLLLIGISPRHFIKKPQ